MTDAAKVPPHVERMLGESNDLADKSMKLATFIGGDIYTGLAEIDRDLLSAQLDAMHAYQTILSIRISRATASAEAN